MEYPDDFPGSLREFVEAAIARAELEVYKQKKKHGQLFPTYWQGALLLWVKIIFFAFAEQTQKLGRDGTWSVERIRTELNAYLYGLAAQAHSRLAPESNKLNDYLVQREVNKIAETVTDFQEWEDLQKQLQEIAETNTNPIYGDIEPTLYHADYTDDSLTAKPKRRHLEANYELLKDPNGKLNRLLAAEAIGTSPRNFRRIVGQEGIKGVGPKHRKQYKVQDLREYLDKKN